MTAEVALLNRNAVALAADSAVTITYWQDGGSHTRYAKGANKIFNIASGPVGLMIYNTDSLQGTPWEVIVKAFRDKHGDAMHNKLEGYADSLFDFIVSDEHIFPTDHQDAYLVETITIAAMKIGFDLIDARDNAAPKKIANKRAAVARRIGEIRRRTDRAKTIGSVDWAAISDRVGGYHAPIRSVLEASPTFKSISSMIDLDEIIRIASNQVFKSDTTTLQTTGVVVAGYGENEYFPRLLGFTCYGVLLGRLLYDTSTDQDVTISKDNVSHIRPIAQSNMVNTFIHGASIGALVEVDRAFSKGIDDFEDDLIKAGHIGAGIDLEPLKTTRKDAFTSRVNNHLWEQHTQPLRRVVGFLSVAELAELAETLISIESLKERVTRPSESVAGPVDVAVITKSDGFIWIRRKHYFDKDLNPRYFARKGLR